MTRFTLRHGLQRGDRPAIARLLETAGVFRPEEVAIGLELVDETLAGGSRSSYRWVLAGRGNQEGRLGWPPCGLACYGPVPLTQGTFDLYWIAVDPRARGCGIASALDADITEELRRSGGRWILAETSSTPPYEAARRFYLRRGYTLLEHIPDFYRVGDDRLTYGKRLDHLLGPASG